MYLLARLIMQGEPLTGNVHSVGMHLMLAQRLMWMFLYKLGVETEPWAGGWQGRDSALRCGYFEVLLAAGSSECCSFGRC